MFKYTEFQKLPIYQTSYKTELQQRFFEDFGIHDFVATFWVNNRPRQFTWLCVAYYFGEGSLMLDQGLV